MALNRVNLLLLAYAIRLHLHYKTNIYPSTLFLNYTVSRFHGKNITFEQSNTFREGSQYINLQVISSGLWSFSRVYRLSSSVSGHCFSVGRLLVVEERCGIDFACLGESFGEHLHNLNRTKLKIQQQQQQQQ